MVLGIALPLPFWAEEVAETIGLLAVFTGSGGVLSVEELVIANGTKVRGIE